MGIRGSQIRDESLESRDIKNETIKFEDLDPADITWKAPVASILDLPPSGNYDGDCRITLDDGSIFIYYNSQWNQSQSIQGAYTQGDFNSDFSSKSTDDLTEGTTNKYFISHDNTNHTETYITASGVNYTNLSNNGSIGPGSSQVAQGNHTHTEYLQLSGGTMTGDIIPINTTVDLGSVTNKFGNIYAQTGHFDASTVYIGTESISVSNGKIAFSTSLETPTVDTMNVDTINLTSVNPSDTATMFGSDNSGDSVFHIRIGNGSADKILFESWNGSTATSLLEVGQTDVTILGNLNVTGTTTTIDSTTINVDDNEIILNSSLTTSPVLDGLITVNRGTETDAQLKWNETTNEWEVGLLGSTSAIATYSSTKTAGRFYTGTTNATSSNRLNYDGYFYATRVYNAVYNDFADFQHLYPNEQNIPGRVYYNLSGGLIICNKRCQKGVTGIVSDTFGIAVGQDGKEDKAAIAVAGWVLAYVDDDYPIGTALVNDKRGFLTKARLYEKVFFPERIIAVYYRREFEKTWGPDNIQVNGRHWVKVK